MPKKIRCTKCDVKLLSFTGSNMTVHSDQTGKAVDIRVEPGNNVAYLTCYNCGTQVPIDMSLLEQH